jgi:CBS domain-containing protein
MINKTANPHIQVVAEEGVPGPLLLAIHADTAEGLMTPDPVSIQTQARVREAAAALCDLGFGALPVVDKAGKLLGVISQSDIVQYERERGDSTVEAVAPPEDLPYAFRVHIPDDVAVQDIMTPVVYAVRPSTSVAVVIDQMLELGVHRLYVVDRDDRLAGVVTAIDVMRNARR